VLAIEHAGLGPVINRNLQINQPKGLPMNTVALASGYARSLVENEARRTGQPIKAALKPVSRRVRTTPSALWSLIFRPPKQISADLLAALAAAMEAELLAEIGRLRNELEALQKAMHRISPRKIAEVEAGIARLRSLLRDGGAS
jgi:hypothetical protein